MDMWKYLAVFHSDSAHPIFLPDSVSLVSRGDDRQAWLSRELLRRDQNTEESQALLNQEQRSRV